jgi:hypothetical protein
VPRSNRLPRRRREQPTRFPECYKAPITTSSDLEREAVCDIRGDLNVLPADTFVLYFKTFHQYQLRRRQHELEEVMRIWVISITLLLAWSAARAIALAARPWELSGSYTYVHSNAPPGGCDCFSMNGGGGEAAYRFTGRIALAGDVTVVHAGNVLDTNRNMTLTSFQAGPRFSVPISTRWTAFGHVLLGAAEAGGSASTAHGLQPMPLRPRCAAVSN